VSLLWGAYTRRKGARYADDQDSEGRVAEREVGGGGREEEVYARYTTATLRGVDQYRNYERRGTTLRSSKPTRPRRVHVPARGRAGGGGGEGRMGEHEGGWGGGAATMRARRVMMLHCATLRLPAQTARLARNPSRFPPSDSASGGITPFSGAHPRDVYASCRVFLSAYANVANFSFFSKPALTRG